MTVTAVRKDPQALTMTIEAEFDASPERVWQLWADPLQLERWWGPPNYPATVTQHNLAPGGRVEYRMIGPAGDRHRGYWEILEVDAPRRLVFGDTHANADGTPRRVSRSRRSASGARACRSRAGFRMPRPWSGSWPPVRTWAAPEPLARWTRSSPNKPSSAHEADDHRAGLR